MSTRAANVNASEALDRLRTGNARYCAGEPVGPNRDGERRQELITGQSPFATVITCADSRVPPELIFDQGLGDLFVIRVAGNVVDDMILGSIEYASLHLGVNLVVVMGHRSCGAVAAAVDNVDVEGSATYSQINHIDVLIEAIRPAVRSAREQGAAELLERSVRENAKQMARQVETSNPLMNKLVEQGVRVRPAYYDLESGRVGWLD